MAVIDLKTIEQKELIVGFHGKLVHTEKLTIAYWHITAGSILPKHSHIHEQISMVTEGEFEMTIGDKTSVLTKGQVAIIPSNTEHSGLAVTDCKITDVFCPAREDYQ